MKHEYACDHWSSTNWVFCRKCFHCYYKTASGGCSGEVHQSLMFGDIFFKYQKEFEATGKITNHLLEGSFGTYQEDESAFTVTRLY